MTRSPGYTMVDYPLCVIVLLADSQKDNKINCYRSASHPPNFMALDQNGA